MNRQYLQCIFILLLTTTVIHAEFLKPSYSISFEGGATESYFISDGQMKYFFEPTKNVHRTRTPSFLIGLNVNLGNYFGASTGLGYTHFGQYTSPTSVYFSNDIYEHDFESKMNIHYLTIPLIVKAGARLSRYSIFLRGGIVPSLCVNNYGYKWIIDGKSQTTSSSRVPDVHMKPTDAPLHFGGEAGVHIGKNGIFLLLQYNYGFRDIAYGIPGNVTVRSYGATLQYRREL